MNARTVRQYGCAVLALALVSGGCERNQDDASPPVAKVGSEVLTARELELMLPPDVVDPEARWNAAERWINRELLYREAVRRGIDRRPDVALQVKTATRELVINAMLEQFFRDELAVSDEEVRQYYNEHRALFRRPETTVHVKQILVENSREAQRIYRQLVRNPEAFEELARRHSTDPSSADGGDIGFISATTAYSPEIWQAIQRLSENQITRPISTDTGWYIFKVVERRPAGSLKSLDEVRLEIINRVRTAKRLALITALVERLKLKEPYVVYRERLGARYVPASVAPDTTSILEDIEAHE